jgi:predicted esterase
MVIPLKFIRMKRIYLIVVCIVVMGKSFSQVCNSPRFTETLVYANADIFIDSNVVYGNAINWVGANETLTYNIAYPKLNVDTMQKRPLVFLIHGGGFVSGDKSDFNGTALLFARRGFISVTIDYRLGRDCSGSDSLSYDKAVYRAVQDGKAAMRFIVNQADSIRLDTNWIFIGGGSAGAGTCLAMIYASQTEMNAAYPTLEGLLGDFDHSTNALTNTFTVKGLFNNWGGVAKNFFEANEAVPTISFHGDADPTVDVDSAYGNSCVNPPIVYGSNLIYQKMLSWGICNSTSIKIGGGHGVYNTTADDINFRTGKASCFFKSVMCGSCFSYYTTDSIPANCSITLSANTEEQPSPFTVYPNPAQTVLYVKPSDPTMVTDLYIYNLEGKVQQISFGKNEIYVQGLTPGIYILQIRDGDSITTHKFVKN